MMKIQKKYTWLCLKDGRPHRIDSIGDNITHAFSMLPKMQQLDAVHHLEGIEVNGVRQ